MLRYLALAAAILASCENSLGAQLQPVNVTQFILDPDQDATLTWNVKSAEPGAQIPCVLRGYGDESVTECRLPISAQRTVEFALRRPQGYYDIHFPESGQRFGLVVLPPRTGAPDAFFSMDTAMSWLVREDPLRVPLIQNLRRCGIAMARERLNWSQINPTRDHWEWDGSLRYDKLRRAYAAEGVELLEMFHDAPGWLGRVEKYPDDLVAAARAWQQISQRWQTHWQALEVWNEPDIFFGGNLPADQYVPLVKALAWTQRQLSPATLLVGGALAHDNARFLDCAAANGLLECVPVASFHTYGRALSMEDLIGRYRQWLQAHGRAAQPLWITECGRPWKKGPDRPPVREDAESALDITMKAVESRACGIARYFAFVYPFYEENESNFGMLARDGTPLRSLAAYAWAATVLQHKRYVGDLRCSDAAVKRARVFKDQRETVVVLYTATSTGSGTVRPGMPVQRLAGIDGRVLQPNPDGSLPASDGLVYAWLTEASLAERLETNSSAAKLWAMAQEAAPPLPSPAPVVLRYQFDPSVVTADSGGYRVKSLPPGKLPLAIRLFNLDRQPHAVTLQASSSPASLRLLTPESATVRVPAEGHADATWQADLSEAFALTGKLRCTVTATSDSAERILPLVMDFTGEATREQILKRYPQRVQLNLGDAAAWRANIVGHGRMTIEPAGDSPWQLNANFGRGDRWVYPILQLPADVDLSRFSSLVIRGRCEQPAQIRVLLHEGDGGVVYLTPQSLFPADGRWHAVAVAFRDFTLSAANAPDPNHQLDLPDVHRVSLGMNSDAERNRLEISDLELVGP